MYVRALCICAQVGQTRPLSPCPADGSVLPLCSRCVLSRWQILARHALHWGTRWQAACRVGGRPIPGKGLSAQEALQIWTLRAEPADPQTHGWRHQAAGRACCRLSLQVSGSPEAPCTSHGQRLPASAVGKHAAIPDRGCHAVCHAASCAVLTFWGCRAQPAGGNSKCCSMPILNVVAAAFRPRQPGPAKAPPSPVAPAGCSCASA